MRRTTALVLMTKMQRVSEAWSSLFRPVTTGRVFNTDQYSGIASGMLF